MDLWNYFQKNTGKKITKWKHYFQVLLGKFHKLLVSLLFVYPDSVTSCGIKSMLNFC